MPNCKSPMQSFGSRLLDDQGTLFLWKVYLTCSGYLGATGLNGLVLWPCLCIKASHTLIFLIFQELLWPDFVLFMEFMHH